MTRKGPGSIPSSFLPLLSVNTDGKAKDRHNREVSFVLRALQKAGIKTYSLHHIRDGGVEKSLPLMKAGKWYDISYVSGDGEIILVEVMRTYTKYVR